MGKDGSDEPRAVGKEPRGEAISDLEAELLKLRSDYRQAAYTLRQTQEAYGRFVPRSFLRLLGAEDILKVNLGHETEKRITIMFSDIRNFTTLSESKSSGETFAFINEYLGRMEPAVQMHRGIVDKFIGDAVMAFFPERAEDALEAAFAMRAALDHYNRHRVRGGEPPVGMGIGLNTGLTTLGVVGHMERMETTIIGDAVNVSSRIEGLTKTYRVGILISEDTLSSLENAEAYSVRFIDRVAVKGRHRPVSVYEVFDGDPPETARGKLAVLEVFEKAVAYCHLGECARAVPLLEQCLKEVPDDPVAALYLERCRGGKRDTAWEFRQQLSWQDDFDTGLADVDAQHRGLLDNINKLSQAIQAEDVAQVGEVFDFLAAYGVEHFDTEEAYMRKYGYPFLAEYAREHAAFVKSLLATRREIMSGRHDMLLCLFRVHQFLYDWLISHSTRTDKHFAHFVLAKMREASA
jgi:hemerythrin